jgi:hypothetical protein
MSDFIEKGSRRTVTVSTVSGAFLDRVRQALVSKHMPASVGKLSARETEGVLVRGLVRMVQRAANRDAGACVGACDLVRDLHGQDVLLMHLPGGVLIGLAMDNKQGAPAVDRGLLDAFDAFEAGRKAEAQPFHTRPGFYR